MKKLIASILMFSLLTISCNFLTPSATPPPDTPATPDPLETPWDDRSIFKDGLVSSAQSALNGLDGATVYHIEFNIAKSLDEITGVQDVHYTNTESESLKEVYFRLFPNILGGKMQIFNLRVNDAVVWPHYELENSLMIVPLVWSLEPGESVDIHMEFSVDVPRNLEQNYGLLAYTEDVLSLAHAYPMIAVFDDEGWNAEIPSQNGDLTYADASFYIAKITAPKDVTVVVSGRRVSHTEGDQTQTLYAASGPARDFYLAASPKYEELSAEVNRVVIRSYTTENYVEGSKFVVDTASRALKIFSERYAPYPYTELDIVSTPTLALGIEYPGMIVVTSWIYEMRGETTNEYLESTVVHEVGHQWFYNLVGDDQLDDPWLDESLTQFITLQYFTDVYGQSGSEEFINSLEFRWDRVNRENIPIGLPVAEYNPGEYGSIVYGRGPLFFVALKEEIGEEAFDAFLKEYTQTLTWDIATPEMLQSIAEKNCACELDDIFNEWVHP